MHESSLFPPELISDLPKITMTGQTLIHLEQHKGLLSYQEDRVTFQTSLGAVTISGQQIHIKQYSASEAVLSGTFSSISYGGKPS